MSGGLCTKIMKESTKPNHVNFIQFRNEKRTGWDDTKQWKIKNGVIKTSKVEKLQDKLQEEVKGLWQEGLMQLQARQLGLQQPDTWNSFRGGCSVQLAWKRWSALGRNATAAPCATEFKTWNPTVWNP